MAPLTNASQQAQINAALKKGMEAGYDEATARKMITERLASQGYQNQSGTLKRTGTTAPVPNIPINYTESEKTGLDALIGVYKAQGKSDLEARQLAESTYTPATHKVSVDVEKTGKGQFQEPTSIGQQREWAALSGAAPTGNEPKRPWYEEVIAEANERAAKAESKRKQAETRLEEERNAIGKVQLEAGVIPTGANAGTTGTKGSLYKDVYGVGKDEFFKESGYQQKIDALTNKAKSYEKLLSGDMTDISDEEKAKINDEYNTVKTRLEEAKIQAERMKELQLGDVTRMWDEKIRNEKRANEIQIANAQKLAALTGASWTATGVASLDQLMQDNSKEISELEEGKQSMLSQYRMQHDAIIKQYTDKITDLTKENKNAIKARYTEVVAEIQKIDAEKGKTTKEGLKELREVGKDYMDFIDKQYNRAFEAAKFEWQKAKDELSANMEADKFAYTKSKDLLSTLSENNGLAFASGSDMAGIAKATGMGMATIQAMGSAQAIEALNDYGKSLNIGDIGTKYADTIRKGIAAGNGPAEVMGAITGALNIPALKREAMSEADTLDLTKKRLEIQKLQTEMEGKTGGAGVDMTTVLGNGTITGYGGEYDGYKGLDIDGKKGDPVMGFSGEITKVGFDNDFGNYVKIKLPDGNTIQLSHLDSVNVKSGQKIDQYQNIGTIGNTGHVIPMAGGDGSHLDIRVTTPDGKTISSREVQNYLQNYKDKTAYGPMDIEVYNSLTPSERKKQQNDPQTRKIAEDANRVYNDKNSTIDQILYYSRGGKPLGDKETEQIGKYKTALDKLGDISETIDDMETGPVIGKLRSLNPWDTDANTLRAQLTSLIPTLARGVYGEVGVLTDNDVRLYAATVPNLEAGEQTNKAILAMTLKGLANGYKNQMATLARSGNDVSRMAGDYEDLMDEVNRLNASIGIKPESVRTPASEADISRSLTETMGIAGATSSKEVSAKANDILSSMGY